MNVEELQKHVSSHVKIHPPAIHKEPRTGTILPPRNDWWFIQKVENDSIWLSNDNTDHIVKLGTNTVKDYWPSGHLLLRCQITLHGDSADIEPISGG